MLNTFIKASVLKEVLEEHLKDTALDENTELLKHDKQKGEKNHYIESQIKDSHTNQYSKASDDGKYLKKEHDTKKTSDNDAYVGYNTKQDKSEDNERTGFKRGHKKGHHKQGFQNSYHKDESSNKSTYFDDFNDENDQSAYNARSNVHDNHGGRSYKGGHNNGQEYTRDNFNSRGINKYRDNGNKQVDRHDYAKKHYLDDYENYKKHRNNQGSYRRDKVRDSHNYRVPHSHQDYGWDQNRWDDRNQWERPRWDRNQGWDDDYGGPGYYDDHGVRHEGGYGYGPNHGYSYEESQAKPAHSHPPLIAERKQTITIYEDPRYDDRNQGQLRRAEGDYLHLDFQPSRQRYARYDDSYYNIPNRDGAMEASRINRLVYNYRRH
ncbi:uncharacterized protein [Battus philenor]|uniref:uncharacterized protein n=1 Tax=Battus philenor TaxID=42288 RepID=UPI0035CFA60A